MGYARGTGRGGTPKPAFQPAFGGPLAAPQLLREASYYRAGTTLSTGKEKALEVEEKCKTTTGKGEKEAPETRTTRRTVPRQFKVVIVGASSVGKTCIAHRL